MYTKVQLAQKDSMFAANRRECARKLLARKNSRSVFTDEQLALLNRIAKRGYAISGGKMWSVHFGAGSRATKKAYLFTI